jgi:hypothetical protein
MARQFVGCTFHPGGRVYTYHNDGEPVAVGQEVRVEAREGSWKAVTVVSITDEAPAFPTKPVLSGEAA